MTVWNVTCVHRGCDVTLFVVTGDNMLTALSVARDCHMIEQHSKVVLVHVAPSRNGQPPQLQWTYTEDTRRPVTEISANVSQVSLVIRTLTWILWLTMKYNLWYVVE